ncbi:MAG: tRNA glutamyl-Q(34) synthetase GluQRS [Pseudomonadota bacterium]
MSRASDEAGGGAVVERFAPSPNGHLHLGHGYSALLAFDAAKAAGGRFLLRWEDIDTARSRAAFEAAIAEDLRWLGVAWPTPALRQSERFPVYAQALNGLRARGLLYPCTCTRRDIDLALSAPQEGDGRAAGARDPARVGPDGPAYPGTCRPPVDAPAANATDGAAAQTAWRLDMRRAVAALGGAEAVGQLRWREVGEGDDHTGGATPGLHALDADYLIDICGDVVLSRKEFPASYHLAVVLDDAAQGVTHVTRGADLAAATAIHRLLQALLGAPTPIYRHHRLIRTPEGKRLAKRDRDAGLRELRAAGVTPAEIRRRLGLPREVA